MKVYIKNMVSARCKMLVVAELKKLNLSYRYVELGEVDLLQDLSNENHDILSLELSKSGLELMDDKRKILVERIKNVVVEMIYYSDELPITTYSNYIGQKLHQHYTYLANLFSEVQGITIEHFIIKHKIEKVKELLVYDELNLTQIAYKMHYSSVAHLSNQFKKVTGLTASHFKKLKTIRRDVLEKV